MQRKAVDEILRLLPDTVCSFEGSDYPLPIAATFLGNDRPDIALIRRHLLRNRDGDIRDLLEPLLLAAELYEASCDDKDRFFLTDRLVQAQVFQGSKWKAGWVLVLGGQDQTMLIEELRQRDFLVFTDLPEIADTVYIGGRPTSPVYFLQLMVRYGLIWGGIAPGDDHRMGHFLESDMPGLIVIVEDLEPLKYLIALGLMKLGAPAVVPPAFPFPYGRFAVADSVREILDLGSRFPNLRRRYYQDEIINLPDFCNPAYAGEPITVVQRLGGKANSFFCVQSARDIDGKLTVSGEPRDEIGVLVEIEHDEIGEDIVLAVEQAALKAVNYLQGIRAYEKDEAFYLEISAGTQFDTARLYEAIRAGIRLQYPRLNKIAVRVIGDAVELRREAERVRDYKNERRRLVDGMTEDNTDDFCVCTECRPFSLVHTCILTPGRVPMCAARSYRSVKAAAYLGSYGDPFKRPSEKELPLRRVFKKGRTLDADRGEYAGCNEIYREMTNGQLSRVFLHSVRDYPLTSCGCFQNLAFWLEEVEGIGIMARDAQAVTPDGQTWEMLANRAGGKQSPGIVGVSLDYIRSPRFLKGDGGMGNVVWVDNGFYKRIADLFLPGQSVATENDVRSMADLGKFLGR